ncbi:AAA family ATPase [Paraburkholderia sp. EG287A]|uniref:AAA family ATPase n=1 Tax=Paraburkholderia sp. EG287A TaxID=3237012 RepID=UPI0034D21E97
MELKAVEVSGFKRLRELELLTPSMTVLVGGNNSGKSSLLQAIHFAVTVLQSAQLSADGGKPMNTLGFDQFIYKPTSDLIKLNHGGPITSKSGPEFTFSYTDAGSDEEKEFKLTLRRGKNANIAITFDNNSTFFNRAASRSQPFSVFVPGLAGVSLREELRTPSVVANGIAQGDSNVYLRNVLFRICKDPEKLTRFHEVIASVFPGLTISSAFDPDSHLYIDITVHQGDRTVPLEMVGTGVLQAMQLVAYVTAYNPALLLLDEPDSHLHPSNQKLLASTLQKIAEDGRTRIVLATHSRHMFDTLARDDSTQIVWLQAGEKQAAAEKGNLSVLLDLGALDSFELVHAGKKRVVVLTEDTKTARLQVLLHANGLAPDDYFLQPLHGVNNLAAAVPVADYFTKQGDNTYVLIHRDGDGMTDAEKHWWTDRESKKLPERTLVFVTPMTDVEHSFCQPAHISAIYGIPLADAEEMVHAVIAGGSAQFVAEFTQKRSSLKDTALKKMDDVPSAVDLLANGLQFEQVKGKKLLTKLLMALQQGGHNPMRLTSTASEALISEALREKVAEIKATIDAANAAAANANTGEE